MKPLIGITTGEVRNVIEPWGVYVYGQKQAYTDAILAAGGVPVLIPFMPESELRQVYERLDGILFSGGNDINPSLYGEPAHERTVDVSDARDAVESTLLKWALDDDLPIFAICRGYQLLNVHLGGTLYQDILSALPEASNHLASTQKEDYLHLAHTLRVEPSSHLASLIDSTEITANTHHHQAVKSVAAGLVPVAWAEDGIIEALEYPGKRYVIGVQSHPESLAPTHPQWARLFKTFVNACGESFSAL